MLLSGFLVRTKKLSTLHVSMHGLLSHSCTFTKDTAAVSAIRGGAFPGDAVQSWSSPCQLWNQLATKIHTFSKDAAFPKNRGSRLLQVILSLVTSILLHVSPTAMTSPFPNLFHNPVASCYPPVVLSQENLLSAIQKWVVVSLTRVVWCLICKHLCRGWVQWLSGKNPKIFLKTILTLGQPYRQSFQQH